MAVFTYLASGLPTVACNGSTFVVNIEETEQVILYEGILHVSRFKLCTLVLVYRRGDVHTLAFQPQFSHRSKHHLVETTQDSLTGAPEANFSGGGSHFERAPIV